MPEWFDYVAAPFTLGATLLPRDKLLGGLGASSNPQDYRQQTRGPYEDQINRAVTQGLATNRTAPQLGMGNDFRNAQHAQLGQLQRLASGQQQGAGELAAQRQAQNAIAQQQSMARMQRGGNAALAARQAANNVANINLSAAGMGQQAAMQDQMQAQGLLTQAAGQGRGQDLQVQIANMDAKLKQMGMDDQTRLAYLQQLSGLNAQQLQAQLGAMQTANAQPGLLGPILSAGSQAAAGAAMSDERVKTDISDARHEVDEMLDALLPKAYKYKNEARHGEGRRVGIMAQDLERSKAGRHIVLEVPDGKAIDLNKAVSAALASAARLNERVRKLERNA